jgi:hypothetical protein
MKLKRNYILWGIMGNLIQYGTPLSYIVWQYDIFKFEEEGRSLTGWAFVSIAIIFFMFKDKITTAIKTYDTHLGQVAQKAKWGFIFVALGGFLALAELWIDGALHFMFTLGISNLVSLIFYTPYFNKKKEYVELKGLIKTRLQEQKIKGVII